MRGIRTCTQATASTSTRSTLTLLLAIGIYLASAVFGWGQQFLTVGVAQRTVYRLRRAADEKLGRLPLRYFDDHPHGDVLSRLTNDLDNIATSLQQSITTLITSVLTIVGVLIMMYLISPLLATISVIVVPDLVRHHHRHRTALAEAVRRAVAAHRRRGRPCGGDVHRPQRRQGLRPPARGHRAVRRAERGAVPGRASGPSSSRASSSRSMMFVGNLNYVAIAVIGGIKVASGTPVARRRAGLLPVLAAVHPAHHPGRQHREHPAERRRHPPSASSSCSTRPRKSPTRRSRSCSSTRRATSRSKTCRSAT